MVYIWLLQLFSQNYELVSHTAYDIDIIVCTKRDVTSNFSAIKLENFKKGCGSI